MFSAFSATISAAYVNGSPAASTTPGGAFWHSVARGGSVISFKNGVNAVTVGVAPTAKPALPFYIMARNSNGVANNFSIHGVSVFGFGSSLNGKESALYNAWNKYKSTIQAKIAYKAITDYATAQLFTLPSAAQQALQEKLITDLMIAGIWDDLDVFYNFVTDGDHNFAKINWKAPGTFQAVGTGHEPTFAINSGFKGDGVSQYLNTGFIPLNGYATDGCIFASVNSAGQPINFISGVVSAVPHHTYIFWDGTAVSGTLNGVAIGISSITPTAIFGHVRRNSTGACNYYNNGVSLGSVSTASNATPFTLPVYLLAANNNGVPGTFAGFSKNMIESFGLGKSLIGKELALYTAWNTYKSTVRSKAAYKAIIDYATLQGYTLPSTPQHAIQEKFIFDLVAAGVWDELDVLYVFRTDGGANFAKINWKNPGTFQCIGTGHDPAFTLNNGFKGNGSTTFLDTQWIPSVNGVKYTLNNAGALIDTNSAETTNGYEFGIESAGTVLRLTTNPVSVVADINDFSVSSIASVGGIGLYLLKRTASNAVSIFKNGSSLFSGAAISTSLPTLSSYICGRNVGNPGVAEPSNRTVSMIGFGSSLTGKESALYNAWNAYKTSIGALEVNITMVVGTDGTDRGFVSGLYGIIDPHMVQDVPLVQLYVAPGDVIHAVFEGAVQVPGVERIAINTPSGDQAVLEWTGTEYVAIDPLVALAFIIGSTVNFRAAT
jgi:hypothetical protein